MVRAVNEIGFKPKMIGGGMVGLQATAHQDAARPAAQRLRQLRFLAAGAEDELPRRGRAHEEIPGAGPQPEGVDPLGYYMAPLGLCADAGAGRRRSTATKSLDDDKLADYIRANTFKTVLGDVKFGARGEWAQSRVLQVQFQNIKGNDVGQFKDMSTQIVLTPPSTSRAR